MDAKQKESTNVALKLINDNPTLIVKIGNIVVSSNARSRLLIRAAGSAIIGFVGALTATFPYCILMLLLYLERTQIKTCYHRQPIVHVQQWNIFSKR